MELTGSVVVSVGSVDVLDVDVIDVMPGAMCVTGSLPAMYG